MVATGTNMTGLGLGPLIAGIFAAYVALPTRSVFWAYLGVCALALVAIVVIDETVREPDRVISVRPRLGVPPGMRAVMTGACLGLTAVLTGLISLLTGTVDASAYTSGLVAAVVVAAFAVVRRTYGTAPAPQSPCTPQRQLVLAARTSQRERGTCRASGGST